MPFLATLGVWGAKAIGAHLFKSHFSGRSSNSIKGLVAGGGIPNSLEALVTGGGVRILIGVGVTLYWTQPTVRDAANGLVVAVTKVFV